MSNDYLWTTREIFIALAVGMVIGFLIGLAF